MADETLNTAEVDTNTQENSREGGGDERQGNKKGKAFFRKKVCRFCAQKAKIDYKDPDSLRLSKWARVKELHGTAKFRGKR